MVVYLSIFKNELKANRGWYIGWIITTLSMSILYMLMYPGPEGMAGLKELLEEPYFKAVVGDLTDAEVGLALWIALTLSVGIILFAIGSLLSGAKVISQSLSDNTGEIIHALPITRNQFLVSRFIAAFFGMILMMLGFFLPLLIPFKGETISGEAVFKATWWGGLYILFFLLSGMVLGIIYAQTGKAQLNAILAILLMYGWSSISNVVDELSRTASYNPYAWYNPSGLFLGGDVDNDLVMRLIILILILAPLAVFTYLRRDLVENTPFLNFSIRQTKLDENGVVKPKKVRSVKSSMFTFWVRPLENRYPILADFVYSERRVLMITFIFVVLLYPGQLPAYDEETISQVITDFGDFPLFTYGHSISDQPYLWFLTTQAIGVHWMYYIPLMLHWIRKIVAWDAEGSTGELIGVQNLDRKEVIRQRYLAVILEMIYLVVWEIIFLLLSEAITGARLSLFWEVVAISGKIVLYAFLLALCVGFSFFRDSQNSRDGRILYILIFTSFLIGISTAQLDNVITRGLFGLFDPVKLMEQQTFAVANYGLIILALLVYPAYGFMKSQSDKFSWIQV